MAPNPASRVHIDPFKLLQIRPKFVMCSADKQIKAKSVFSILNEDTSNIA